MSIESKHAYRCGYLKSDQWKNVRLEALVLKDAKCEICEERDISNDAHHIWYPEDVYETTPAHLAILCRPCHEFVHAMLPQCKTRDKKFGRKQWELLRRSIITWRVAKHYMFSDQKSVDSAICKRIRETAIKIAVLLYAQADKRGNIRISKIELGEILSPLKNFKP